MIRPGDAAEATRLREMLSHFEVAGEPLYGLTGWSREVFVAQLIESQRRVRYLHTIRQTGNGDALNPQSISFDPLKGAVLSSNAGEFDEACWLVFLSVHFGRHRRHQWALSRAFYGRLGQGGLWNGQAVSADPGAAIDWLAANESAFRALGVGFGNHRKYQSISARSPRGTGATIRSYVEWVGSSHAQRFADVGSDAKSSTERFSALYDSLRSVTQFGRTARFDYLRMLGKLGVAEVEADSVHLSGSTGPLSGARLLLTGSKVTALRASDLESRLVPLRELLGVSFDVLEDALCNWQKSPNSFVPFRG